MNKEQEAQYNVALKEALDKGYAILEKGGTSLDAVVAAIAVMEDNPLFNAGRGSVFTKKGLMKWMPPLWMAAISRQAQ